MTNDYKQVELSEEKVTAADFQEWLAALKRNGFEQFQVDCEDCSGAGKIECPHCGEGQIECQDCEGYGNVAFPAFIDYVRLRQTENKLLRMWKNGEAAKTMTVDDKREFPVLPHFLAGEDPTAETSEQLVRRTDTKNPFTIHILGIK